MACPTWLALCPHKPNPSPAGPAAFHSREIAEPLSSRGSVLPACIPILCLPVTPITACRCWPNVHLPARSPHGPALLWSSALYACRPLLLPAGRACPRGHRGVLSSSTPAGPSASGRVRGLCSVCPVLQRKIMSPSRPRTHLGLLPSVTIQFCGPVSDPGA